MNSFPFAHQRLAYLVCAAIAFAPCFGCGEADQIRAYTVAKESPPVGRQPSSPAAKPTDRMLAAILPAGGQAWFFKVVGPIEAVDKHADEINEFYTSVRLDESGRARWTTPATWKEDPPAMMRAATLWVPADDKPLEISVTTLPWSGAADSVLVNVNRWRDQLQLPPIGQRELAEYTREENVGDATVTLVDLRGQFKSSGMMGPFAGGMGGGGGSAPSEGAGLPAGHPPLDGAAPSQPSESAAVAAEPGLPKFDVPQSWQQRPPSMSMRKAEFLVADDQKQALVTLTDFPRDAGPMIADPLENVNRWRGEIGLGQIQKADLPSVLEKFDVAGHDVSLATLIPNVEIPEQSQAVEATLAAMVTTGDRIWFVKMRGDRELVAAQQDQFEAFVKSFGFTSDEPEANKRGVAPAQGESEPEASAPGDNHGD